MNALKNDNELARVPLEGRLNVAVHWEDAVQKAAADTYQRIGGLLDKLAERTAIDPSAALAVWLAESSARPFQYHQAVIRFEVHHLFELWGKRNRQEFVSHFRFGGHSLQPGHPWENHEFRSRTTDQFTSVHHNQKTEYSALTLAQVLATEESGLRCASIGGCQILMSAFAMLGYDSAKAMYQAFQASERNHILGFFSFCYAKPAPKTGDLIVYLRQHDWLNFAKYYNGGSQMPVYAAKMRDAYEAATLVTHAARSV
jgi:hypothetical protein